MTEQATVPDGHDERIEALINEISELPLPPDHSSDQRTADALARVRDRWRTTRTPVVLSGEVSTGKSELLNGLVGERILPKHFAACSSVWVRLRYSAAFCASARLRTDEGSTTRALPREDLETYLAVKGMDTLRARHGRCAWVEFVEVGLPAPLLASGIELIDTPGVGGLTAAHSRAAFEGLSEADAVVYVTKALHPMSASERRFLADAVERVSVCLIVSTHRDQVLDGDATLADDTAWLRDSREWTEIVGNESRARALAARFGHVPAVSVSSTNRLSARELPPGIAREDLERASNLATLEDLLHHQVADRVAVIHRHNGYDSVSWPHHDGGNWPHLRPL